VTIRQNRLLGIVLGLAATAATTAASLRWGETLERRALDWRFRHAQRLEASPRIVHVDIDDGSLERIGRWPWHRDVLADLVRTLHELGAAAIALDLILDAPQPARVEHLDSVFGDAGEEMLGRLNEENIVFPDRELADAIRRSGNVFIGAHFELRPPGTPPSQREAALQALRTSLDVTAPPAPELHAVLALVEQFDLDEISLATALGVDASRSARILPAAKRDAAAVLAARFFREQPDADFVGFLAHMLPGADPQAVTPDVRDLRIAFDQERALKTLVARSTSEPRDALGRMPMASGVIPPLETLGAAARDIGFVVFRRDADGFVRQMPLLVEYEGRLIKQLGFAVACHALGLTNADLNWSPDGRLEIDLKPPESARRVQLDRNGEMIIPWTTSGTRWRQGADFRHLPSASVLAIAFDRRHIRENDRRIRYLTDRHLVPVARGEFVAQYVRKTEELLSLSRAQRQDAQAGREESESFRERAARIADLESELARERENTEAAVRMFHNSIQGLDPESDEETEQFDAYRQAHSVLTERIEPLRRANETLAERIAAATNELRPLLQDRLVFVGYTATAEGDIVPTAIDHDLPGVMAHSNVANAFLNGRFIARPPRVAEVVLVLLFGIVVTLLTATRGPIQTLLLVLGLTAGYAVVNVALLFAWLRMWVVLPAPILTAGAAWAVVTVWRQLTAERQKRYVQSQLAEFTDPALARRIAEDPAAAEALQRVENREVSCFFSDLAGFTSIAEGCESGRVQRVLNTYMDRMSEVLFHHEAFVNKFLGDGIMAFFNPNVNPQPDHARLACEAALEAFDALERLKREMKDAEPLYDRLHMRIGLATGVGGVGRYGSRRKADYTVIGDVANLAARLEPANKVFGTRLLVSGPTREVVQDLYEWRYVAELQVKGKQQTVPVFELVCRKGGLIDDLREYIDRFEQGVALYRQQRWDECIVQFMRILARRVDDLGASAYVDACQEKKLFPPSDGWNGALELKEK
jgi:class 3 adenylate cyclase/CHASE2 domain-containing sensor protein